ncbi:asialoglycoprotein receptor 2-like [Erpetoichthys calabaricus]|uniref:asialoglycoprotein receptor 2-like n=1 Tax=Erpetoichthys calabaricus TaxID=27687 RepID=UPI0022343C29|nr:asialoglycoprotein receptor 2-like [Erpetoichthys calabaricus]
MNAIFYFVMYQSDEIKSKQTEWKTFESRSYYFEKEQRTDWDSANLFCRNQNASLAVINDEKEWEYVKLHYKGPTWIGVINDNNIWKWIDKTAFNYNIFKHEVKQQKDGSDCANIMNENVFAAPCKTRSHWICEK